MKNFFEQYIKYNIPFFILFGIALGLIMISWIMPPPWEIHDSVLKGVAEIIGMAALWTVIIAIEKGGKTKFKYKDTEIEYKGNHKEEEDD